jgi:hypothetical protein
VATCSCHSKCIKVPKKNDEKPIDFNRIENTIEILIVVIAPLNV